MENNINETVLLVCDCDRMAGDILKDLLGNGFNVVGPVTSASTALAVAAQTFPTIAVVATEPTGRRKAAELAHELMVNWGIRSWILEQATVDSSHHEAAWTAPQERVAHLRRALENAPDQEAA